MKPIPPSMRVAGASVGAAVCGGVAAVVGAPLLVAAVLGGAAYCGFTLIFSARKKSAAEVANEEVQAVLAEATARVTALEKVSAELPRELARETKLISETARSIMAEIAEQPQDLMSGRRFLTHYLDSTQKALDYYARLHSRKSTQLTGELDQKVVDVVTGVRESFQRQRENLMSDEVAGLSTELDVLKQSIEMEGDGTN